jgi:hypothetical protein
MNVADSTPSYAVALLGIAITAVGGLIAWVDRRVRSLEVNTEGKEEAAIGRDQLRNEVHDLRDEVREDLRVIRTEASAKREEIRSDMQNFRTEVAGKFDNLTNQIRDLTTHLLAQGNQKS